MVEAVHSPPASNRGVQNTSEHLLRACLDWVQVTFTTFYSVQQIYTVLGMEETDFYDFQGGIYGYKSHKKCGHISVLYDGAAGMGVHVQMTGQGCREYETYGKKTWHEFIRSCFEHGGNFTRLDGAIDDICYGDVKPYFTINTLYRKVKDGCAESRFKRGKRVESFSVNDGRGMGETLYFGREQSDIQVRFYEKDFERIEAGKELEEGLTAWNRTELQCRRERAQALALYILNNNNLGEVLAGILKNYLNFLVKNPKESNRSRWKTSQWWLDFLGDVEPLKLTMVAPDKTIEKARQWAKKQVAPTLGMLFYSTGADMGYIVDLLNEGMERMTDEQRKLAEDNFAKLIEEREEWEYLKKQKYQEYMFRSTNTEIIKSPSVEDQ